MKKFSPTFSGVFPPLNWSFLAWIPKLYTGVSCPGDFKLKFLNHYSWCICVKRRVNRVELGHWRNVNQSSRSKVFWGWRWLLFTENEVSESLYLGPLPRLSQTTCCLTEEIRSPVLTTCGRLISTVEKVHSFSSL